MIIASGVLGYRSWWAHQLARLYNHSRGCMNTGELKYKLLETGLFIDNNYLDKYVQHVLTQNQLVHVNYQSEKHHIIPRCYFVELHKPVDNSSENIVDLMRSDHCIAHVLLSLCAKSSRLQQANYTAAYYTLRTKGKTKMPIEDINKLQSWLQELNLSKAVDFTKSEQFKFLHTQLRWYTDGKSELYMSIDKTVPDGYFPGRLRTRLQGLNKGTFWANDGVKNFKVTSLDSLPEGVHAGMLPSESKHCNCGRFERTQATRDKLSAARKAYYAKNPGVRNAGNFVKGQVGILSGRISITNGVKNKFIFKEDLPKWESIGWYCGSTQVWHKRKGK